MPILKQLILENGRSLRQTTSSHSRFGASRLKIRTPITPPQQPVVGVRPVTSAPARGTRKVGLVFILIFNEIF